MESKLKKLKYPVGNNPPEAYSQNYIKERINEIAGFLQNLKKKCLIYRMINSTLLIERMAGQCGKSFTIVPIVMNCFIRIKWVLTEATPIIKSYDENVWATLQDSLTMSIEPTLNLLEGLHYRMAYLMQNLSED
jgi:hypothetical protein